MIGQTPTIVRWSEDSAVRQLVRSGAAPKDAGNSFPPMMETISRSSVVTRGPEMRSVRRASTVVESRRGRRYRGGAILGDFLMM